MVDARVHSRPILHAARWWSKRYNASQVMVWIHSIRVVEAHQWTSAITATRIVAFQTASAQLTWSDLHTLQTIYAITPGGGNTIDLHFQFDIAVWCCWKRMIFILSWFIDVNSDRSPVSVFPQPATSNGTLSKFLFLNCGSNGKQIGFTKSVKRAEWPKRSNAMSLFCVFEFGSYCSCGIRRTTGMSCAGSEQ